MSLISIVLVNYNTPDDTIECIDSLLSNIDLDYFITVIDNSNNDDSLNKITNWISGKYKPQFTIPELIAGNISGKNPESFQVYHSENPHAFDDKITYQQKPPKLTFIKNKLNVGFANANNIGITYSGLFNPTYYWLLNNDTVINKSTLPALIHHYNQLIQQGSKVGLIGSKILFYKNPEIIQSVGNRFNYLTTKNYPVGLYKKDSPEFIVNVKVDYPYGASLFMHSNYISDVGLMCTDYFLYFEELDWVIRGKKAGYKISVCLNSSVFHKQGIATGKSITQKKLPAFIACLMYSNLLKFYLKFYPWLYPVALLKLFTKMVINLFKLNYKEALLILKIMFGFRNCTFYKNTD